MDASNQPTQPGASAGSSGHQQQQDHVSASSSSAQVAGTPSALLRCEWQACGQRMETPELLYDHVCEHHVGRKSTNNLNLTCSWGTCHTTTVKRDHITSHIRVHIPLKPHKCDFCQKAFKRPQDLKKHVKTHAEEPSFQPSPEPSRSLPHQQPGYGPPGKMNDMQHMTSASYYPEQQAMHTAPPVYHQQYPNGGPGNPNAYHQGHSQPHYQSHYATTIYPVTSSLNAEYEVRKKATMDALNEFFGDIKTRQLDSGAYSSVSQRLMHLHNLPSLSGGTEYSAGTAVATAAAPLTSHYTLPLSNVRTKQDLHNIDHFLESVQTTIYDHESSPGAAAAGVAQPGAHYIHAGVNMRTSNSPTQLSSVPQVSSHILPPPMTTTANDTPALTPASSVVSYNSPGSVHSQTISPVAHQSNASLYPTLPSVTASADGNGYTTTSSAMPPSLATSFDPDGRRRYSAGLLQTARRDADDDSLPEIHRLGVGSPNMAKLETPPFYGAKYHHPHAVQSAAIDPALDPGSARSHEQKDPDWLTKVRVLEEIRNFIRFRMDHGIYDEDSPRGLGRGLESENERLYPNIREADE